jgi:GH24 family phage-related lysozyme (muramidase)
MHQSVRDVWEPFNRKYEGWLPFPYLDVRGLVTVGMGNLADPIELALRMPWGATTAQVRRDWGLVKSRQDLRQRPGAFEALTTIRLSDVGIRAIVAAKLLANESVLRLVWQSWNDFPADAQLGILSMAWAMGPVFWKKFPKFTDRVTSRDWAGAALECKINETGNPGVARRNIADRKCFLDAAFVSSAFTRVHWEGIIT